MKGIVLGGRYEILEKVGGGGMAIVYKAKCQLLNRYVAVKVLRDEFTDDDEFIKKFRQESQAAASLSHPNIVGVYDVGEEVINGKEIYYIIMEFIDGKTLKEVIQEEKKLSIDDIVDYGIQIAEALEDAHKNHIIHRDIKPHNIMITKDKRAKVTDFGIARAVTSSTVTNTSNVIGSVHYFSPEQARGGFTDEKSDIYSLGVVMYEMATGKVPYTGETPIAVALKHIQQEMPSILEIRKDFPKALNDIIMKCSKKIQADRYQDVRNLIRDLKKFKKNGGIVDGFSDTNIVDSPTQIMNAVEIDESVKKEKQGNKMKKSKKPKKKKTRVTVSAIILAFLFAMVLFFGAIKIKKIFSLDDSENIIVPNILGMEEYEAKQKLESMNLKLVIKGNIQSSNYKTGEICYQTPKENTEVKKGTIIEAQIANNNEKLEDVKSTIKVPDFRNQSIEKFENIVLKNKLNIGEIDYEYNDSVEEGYIISQTPNAYSEVEKGTKISVLVSKGKENIETSMPNLIGMTENDAKNALVSNSLNLGSKDEKHSNKYPKGTVMWQSINSGTKIDKNTSVSIIVSLGEEQKEEEKPFNFNLTVPQKDEPTSVKIVRLQKGHKENVYNSSIEAGNTSINITLKGLPGSTFQIFLDGQYHDTIAHPNN